MVPYVIDLFGALYNLLQYTLLLTPFLVVAYLIVRSARRLGLEERMNKFVVLVIFPLTASAIILKILNREIPFFSLWGLIGTAILPVLVLLTFVLLIAQVRRTMRSRAEILALLLVAFFFLEPGWLFSASNQIYYTRRDLAVNEFVREIEAYGRIKSMSDGLRAYKDLNGRSITYDQAEEHTSGPGRDVLYFMKVLEEDGVDINRYEEFRTRLIDLGLISFETTDSYIVFTKDGFLNTCHGLLYSRPRASLEDKFLGAATNCGSIRFLDRLDERWYFYGV